MHSFAKPLQVQACQSQGMGKVKMETFLPVSLPLPPPDTLSIKLGAAPTLLSAGGIAGTHSLLLIPMPSAGSDPGGFTGATMEPLPVLSLFSPCLVLFTTDTQTSSGVTYPKHRPDLVTP